MAQAELGLAAMALDGLRERIETRTDTDSTPGPVPEGGVSPATATPPVVAPATTMETTPMETATETPAVEMSAVEATTITTPTTTTTSTAQSTPTETTAIGHDGESTDVESTGERVDAIDGFLIRATDREVDEGEDEEDEEDEEEEVEVEEGDDHNHVSEAEEEDETSSSGGSSGPLPPRQTKYSYIVKGPKDLSPDINVGTINNLDVKMIQWLCSGTGDTSPRWPWLRQLGFQSKGWKPLLDAYFKVFPGEQWKGSRYYRTADRPIVALRKSLNPMFRKYLVAAYQVTVHMAKFPDAPLICDRRAVDTLLAFYKYCRRWCYMHTTKHPGTVLFRKSVKLPAPTWAQSLARIKAAKRANSAPKANDKTTAAAKSKGKATAKPTAASTASSAPKATGRRKRSPPGLLPSTRVEEFKSAHDVKLTEQELEFVAWLSDFQPDGKARWPYVRPVGSQSKGWPDVAAVYDRLHGVNDAAHRLSGATDRNIQARLNPRIMNWSYGAKLCEDWLREHPRSKAPPCGTRVWNTLRAFRTHVINNCLQHRMVSTYKGQIAFRKKCALPLGPQAVTPRQRDVAAKRAAAAHVSVAPRLSRGGRTTRSMTHDGEEEEEEEVDEITEDEVEEEEEGEEDDDEEEVEDEGVEDEEEEEEESNRDASSSASSRVRRRYTPRRSHASPMALSQHSPMLRGDVRRQLLEEQYLQDQRRSSSGHVVHHTPLSARRRRLSSPYTSLTLSSKRSRLQRASLYGDDEVVGDDDVVVLKRMRTAKEDALHLRQTVETETKKCIQQAMAEVGESCRALLSAVDCTSWSPRDCQQTFSAMASCIVDAAQKVNFSAMKESNGDDSDD